MKLQIDDRLKQILHEWLAPSIAAAKTSRIAAKLEMPKPPKKVKEVVVLPRPRCEEHREIYFTLSGGRVLSACAASECFWSADQSQHEEDSRYRKRHSDGLRNHSDISDVESTSDGEGVQEIEVEELSVAGMMAANAVADEDGVPVEEVNEIIPQEAVDDEVADAVTGDEEAA